MKTQLLALALVLAACNKPGPDLHIDDLALEGTHDLGGDLGAPVAHEHWIMGYYAGYESALVAVDAIDWTALTHVAVAFYTPKTDGTLDETLSQGSVAQGQAMAKSIVDAAHAHGRKAIISIGGASSHALWVSATSSAHLSTFVAALTALLKDPGFDGIDLDWEPVDYANDGPLMKALVDALRAAAPGAILTMPVPPLNTNQAPSLSLYAGFASELDQLNVMTYGMAGAYSGWKSWHSSALYQSDPAAPESVDGSIGKYLAAGIDAKHLGVGTGAYGLCYTSPVTAPLQALGAATITDSGLSYASISMGYEPLGTKTYDAAAHVPYLTMASDKGPSGSPPCRYLSYEDPQSVGDKATYVKDKGLGGVIIWTIGKGRVGTTDPLLDAYGSAL